MKLNLRNRTIVAGSYGVPPTPARRAFFIVYQSVAPYIVEIQVLPLAREFLQLLLRAKLMFVYFEDGKEPKTQKNKATAYHLGLLKAKLAKLRRELLRPTTKGGFSMVLLLFSATSPLSRLTSIYLGFAPLFYYYLLEGELKPTDVKCLVGSWVFYMILGLDKSIFKQLFTIIYRYEAVFYGALGLALFGWILFENALLYVKKPDRSITSLEAENGSIILEEGDRCLQLSDMRIPVVFLVFFNIAFFGTGNFASIASFEISSVYRFVTIVSEPLSSSNLNIQMHRSDGSNSEESSGSPPKDDGAGCEVGSDSRKSSPTHKYVKLVKDSHKGFLPIV
ncbi:transferase,sulfuric ester hydrolase [Artemisia annua]|uniref:GPI ethanolamine phosphate transferase 1 n=1 Tax=Artemisia annua TaxID=35608 RepID=A0A2U1L2F3_ARTAN|nr:transferase,sulfuric ester hydrolase [Artemisia annua]